MGAGKRGDGVGVDRFDVDLRSVFDCSLVRGLLT